MAQVLNLIVVSFFALVIISVFFGAMYFFRKEKYALVRPVPVILTSLGILGTFSGVFIGLLGFEVANTKDSFPILLNGLKIAFVTSIIGLGLALVFRIYMELSLNRDEVEIKAEDLYALVKEGVDATKEATTAFESFSDKMAGGLVEALEKVAQQFGDILTEKVGESFKHLAAAVDNLVEWQKNYKSQMDETMRHLDEMMRRQNEALDRIKRGEESLTGISESLDRIPENIKAVSDVMNVAQTQLDKLEENLRAFAEMRDKASDVFPEIQRNMESLTTGLRQTVEEHVRTFSDIIESQRRSAEQIQGGFEQVRASAESAVKNIEGSVSGSLEKMDRTLEESLRNYEKTQKEHLEEVKGSLSEIARNLSGAVRSLDENMRKHLERTMQELADYLHSIISALREKHPESFRATSGETERDRDDH
ncbi:MAG: hypothetical protein MPJ22_01095 [Pirellulales bacterium]|nr:hypothetical protein [Pirellulales bacterium]